MEPRGERIMSREFYAVLERFHRENACTFVRNNDGIKRHVTVRIVGEVAYVYLHENGVHIQTQHVEFPDRWMDNWPRSERTVKAYIRRNADIGSVPIVDLDA